MTSKKESGQTAVADFRSCGAFATCKGANLGAKGLRAVNVVSIIIVAVFARTGVIEPRRIGLIPFDSSADTVFEGEPPSPA